jgi:hypothetical protein
MCCRATLSNLEGNPYIRERLNTFDLLVNNYLGQLLLITQTLFFTTSYPNEEVNRTEPSPSVSYPWFVKQTNHNQKFRGLKDKPVGTTHWPSGPWSWWHLPAPVPCRGPCPHHCPRRRRWQASQGPGLSPRNNFSTWIDASVPGLCFSTFLCIVW